MNQTLSLQRGCCRRTILRSGLLLSLFLLALQTCPAAFKTWDGSSSGLWSAGANWSGGTRPQNGDILHFPNGVTQRTMTNDINNLQVMLIQFTDSDSTNYVLRGNPLTVGGASGTTGGIQSNQTNGVNTIECDITLQRSDLSLEQNFIFIFPGSGKLTLSGDLSIAVDGVSLRSDPGSLLELSGSISGTGPISLVGAGTTLFDGSPSNTYTNTTFVQHGLLQLNKFAFVIGQGLVGRTAVSGDLVVSSSGLVRLLFDNQIANTANVALFTSLDLNGRSDTIGSLTISGGSVTNGGTLGLNGDVIATSSGSVVATLDLGSSPRTFLVTNSTLQVNGSIIGAGGGIIKTGPGTLRFLGTTDNTYSGDTEVRGGVLELSKTSALAISNSASLIIGNSGDGSATDTVRYLAASQLPLSVNLFIKRTGLLDLNDFTDAVGDIDMVAGTIDTGTGTLQLRGNFTAVGDNSGLTFLQAHVLGNLDLGPAARTFTVNNSAFLQGIPEDLLVDAVITGTAGFIKAGPGEMILNGANTFTGGVTVNDGTLILGSNTALGSTASPGTVVNNAARIILAGGVSVGTEPLTLNSTATNPAALFASGSSNFWGGNIFLNRTTHIGVETNSILNLGGAISGSGGLVKDDDGELIFTGGGANTYGGQTIINGGTLFCNKIGTDTSIPGDLIIGDGLGGANADLVFFSLTQINDLSRVTINSSGALSVGADTIGSLSGSGNLEILNTGTLITGGNNDSTAFSGIISGGGSLTKRGTGTFTLTGNNTYTGDTRVEAGALVVNGSQSGSDVTVLANATLAGSGRVGGLNVATSGHVTPGNSPGRLTASSTVLSNDAVLHIELNGPIAGSSYDQLRVLGGMTLTGSKLAPSLAPGFAPFEGEVFTIIDNNGTDPVVGLFDNLATGAVTNVNGIPMRIDYNGLTGNDVTLTVTNLPARGSTVAVVTGNGDGRIDPNECNQLFLRVTNSAGVPLTNVHGVLSTTTPGVLITEPVAAYPDMKTAGSAGTNLIPFQFSTTPGFLCGQSIEFLLTLSASNQTPFAVRSVIQSGTLTASQSFTNNSGVGIPPSGATASPIVVSNIVGGVARVTVSMALTHQNLGELQIFLIPPSGPAIPLAVGLPGTQLGTNCTNGRVTFDDDAAQPIEAGVSPYVGTFRPDAPLSIADGDTGSGVNGVWLLQIIDVIPNSSVGALSCWSLTITPATCAAGSGPCSICNGPFLGSITASDPPMATTIPSSGPPSVCGVAKSCPGVVATPSRFDAFTFTNGSAASCVTVTLDSPCLGTSTNTLGCAAYLSAFNPANPCQNYLADLGDFTFTPQQFSFNIPSNAVFVVVVAGVTNDCSQYTLRVDGFDCPVQLGFGRTSAGRFTIDWPNHASGFNLEWTTNLATGPWLPVTNVPVANSGQFIITNDITAPRAFYRLHKP